MHLCCARNNKLRLSKNINEITVLFQYFEPIVCLKVRILKKLSEWGKSIFVIVIVIVIVIVVRSV